MDDGELRAVLRRTLVEAFGADVRVTHAEVVRPGLVRAGLAGNDSPSFLLSAEGGALRYDFPEVTDEEAARRFEAGERTPVNPGILEPFGIHPRLITPDTGPAGRHLTWRPASASVFDGVARRLNAPF